MVKTCKSHLTDDGMIRIWDQPREVLVKKIQHCINLYEHYQACFQKTKTKLEQSPDEKNFDFSEMYIFGKFDAFCKRLDKVFKELYFFIWLSLPYYP